MMIIYEKSFKLQKEARNQRSAGQRGGEGITGASGRYRIGTAATALGGAEHVGFSGGKEIILHKRGEGGTGNTRTRRKKKTTTCDVALTKLLSKLTELLNSLIWSVGLLEGRGKRGEVGGSKDELPLSTKPAEVTTSSEVFSISTLDERRRKEGAFQRAHGGRAGRGMRKKRGEQAAEKSEAVAGCPVYKIRTLPD